MPSLGLCPTGTQAPLGQPLPDCCTLGTVSYSNIPSETCCTLLAPRPHCCPELPLGPLSPNAPADQVPFYWGQDEPKADESALLLELTRGLAGAGSKERENYLFDGLNLPKVRQAQCGRGQGGRSFPPGRRACHRVLPAGVLGGGLVPGCSSHQAPLGVQLCIEPAR